jgi:hypothetical protein
MNYDVLFKGKDNTGEKMDRRTEVRARGPKQAIVKAAQLLLHNKRDLQFLRSGTVVNGDNTKWEFTVGSYTTKDGQSRVTNAWFKQLERQEE